MVYDRASLKSSRKVLFSKCRISSLKQEEAGSEIRVAGSYIWQDFPRKIRRLSPFSDDVHRESRIPIGAPYESMIAVLFANGQKPLVPPKRPRFRRQETLSGLSHVTWSIDIVLNGHKPCRVNNRLADIQVRKIKQRGRNTPTK
jgi:hypothetical protein